MLPHLKKISALALIIALFFLALASPTSASAISSSYGSMLTNFATLSGWQLEMFSQNNILFYDPSASSCYGGGASLLSGSNFEEKVWNYFVNANIPGVSDNAAAIAGIMGNLYVESNYDPFLFTNDDVHYGIYQTEKSNVKGLVDDAIPSAPWHKGVNGDPSKYPEGITTQAIQIELNQMTQQNPRFQLFLKDLGKVSNNTGEAGAASFAELFLVHMERAVSDNNCAARSNYGNGVALSDPGVQQAANDLYKSNPSCQNVKYQDTSKRIDAAKRIFNQYSSTSGSPSTASGSGACGGINFCASGEKCTSDGFTTYSQSDGRWANNTWGDVSGTISDSGCGPTSFAEIATNLLNRKILPDEVANIAGAANMHVAGSGSSHDITRVLANHYNLEYKELSWTGDDQKDIDMINELLNSGWIIHTSGKEAGTTAQRGSGVTPYSNNGHYVVLRKLSPSGKWIFGTNNAQQSDDEYDPKEVIKYMNRNTGTGAVRAGANSCIETCVSSFSVEGGFTNEQAKEFAQKYKDAPTNDWSVPVNSSGKWNCVSLSAFFVQKFTSIGRVSRSWGNGRDVTYKLAQAYNLPHGSAPRPYSIFSVTQGSTICSDGLKCGHTGVVLAVNGDDVTTVEAAFGNTGYTEVKHRPLSYFKNDKYGQDYAFTYLDNILYTSKLNEFMEQ